MNKLTKGNIKHGYLKQISSTPVLWRYCERFNIKPDFSIWLHSPWERINAIKSQSHAVFIDMDGHKENLSPWQLKERIFRKAGVLDIKWTLEVLENPFKAL